MYTRLIAIGKGPLLSPSFFPLVEVGWVSNEMCPLRSELSVVDPTVLPLFFFTLSSVLRSASVLIFMSDVRRTIYLSERTGEMPDANTLLVANARVANEHVTMSTSVAKKWSDSVYREPLQASDFRIVKRIIHPGEVNRIRELREGIVVTHSDHPHLFVWDTEKQTNRKEVTSKETPPNVPDLTLTGHTANAEYAVESAENGKVVASGGDDTNVLIWHLEDYQTLLNSGFEIANPISPLPSA